MHLHGHAGLSLRNVAGQDAQAIQLGSHALAGSYSFWLQAGQYFFALVTTTYLVWTKNHIFALALLGLVVVQAVLSVAQARALQHDREELDERRNDLAGRSDDILDRRDVILAHERQDHYVEKLRGFADEYARVEQRLAWHEEAFRGFGRVVSDFGRMGVLVVALIVVVATRGAGVADVGDAYFLLSLYWRMLAPVQSLLVNYDDVRRAKATSRRFLLLLAGDGRRDERRAGGPPAGDAATAIEFRSVDFSYPSDDGPVDVLRDCSFHVPANATTLLLGRSGSGKTTIARILLGFLEPSAGEVLVRGRPLQSWTPTELREEMAYIAQGENLVDEYVRDNFFHANLTDEQMLQYLADVGLPRPGSDAAARRDLLDTWASRLSGGQKQRLALARALAHDANVVIMDEPLTGVDVFTFRDVNAELRAFLGGGMRTILMVSHRLSFAASADYVVVLGDHGYVTEEGPREALIHAGGEFCQLSLAAGQELVPHLTAADLV